MSKLTMIEPEAAEGKAKILLESVRQSMPAIPNIAKAMAVAPAVLEAYLSMNEALADGALDTTLAQQLALAVAEACQSPYCLSAHTYIARSLGVDGEELAKNRRARSSDAKVEAALRFARIVLAGRGAVTEDDFRQVRAAGYSDEQAAEIVAHVAMNVLTSCFANVAQTPLDFPAVEPLADAGRYAAATPRPARRPAAP